MKTYMIALSVASLLMIGCNQNVEKASREFNELPTAVQKTVRAHSPNGEISSVDKREVDGQTVYDIKFAGAGPDTKITVAYDGRMLQSDTTKGAPGVMERVVTGRGAVGTELSALPKAVQETVQQRAPNAPIADISRSEDNGRVIYTIEFKDKGANPTMRVANDGQFIDLKK
jgi:uncharacterized membrane protein YkoI